MSVPNSPSKQCCQAKPSALIKPCPKPKLRCAPRCARKGIVTRNAFFNFLRIFRKKHCGMSITQIAVLGAHRWHCMSTQERRKYVQEASCAPRFRYRSGAPGRKPKCAKPSTRGSRKRSKSHPKACRRGPGRPKCIPISSSRGPSKNHCPVSCPRPKNRAMSKSCHRPKPRSARPKTCSPKSKPRCPCK